MQRLRIPRSLPVSILLVHGLASAAMSVTEGRDHWEARLDFQNPRPVSVGAGLYRIELGGAMNAEVGAPDLPAYFFHLAVPPEGEPSIEVMTDSAITIPAHPWAAVPAPSMTTPPPVPASRDARPALATETSIRDGVRILRLRVPLAEIRPDGSVRQAVRLRVRVGYPAGQASTPLPRQIQIQVDNPAAPFGASATIGPRARSAVASRLGASRRSARIGLQEMRNALVLKVGDRDFFGTAEDRIIRVTGAMIRSTSAARSLPGISLANLAVYAGNPDTLPAAAGEIAQPSLEPIAIEVIDRLKDGLLDDDDEIRFFVQGTAIWKRNPEIPVPSPWELSSSPFAWQRTYLIDLTAAPGATSPRLAAPRAPGAPVTLAWLWHPAHARRDSILSTPEIGANHRDPASGTSWFWMLIDKRTGVAAARMGHPSTTSLPGLLESREDSGYLVLRAAPESGLGDLDSARLLVNGAQPRRIADLSRSRVQVWGGARLRESGNAYEFTGISAPKDTLLPFSSYTVHYPRLPAYQAGKGGMRLFSPQTGAVRIRIDGLPAASTAYVIERNRLVRTARIDNGHLLDSISDPETQYLVVGPDDLQSGSADSLREWTPPAQDERMLDYAKGFGSPHPGLVVIAPADFVGAAMQYADYRLKKGSPFNVRIARLEDIYQLYSGGAQDPVAIRDFLRYARSTWGITHCLLLGDGHYDYRGIRTSVRNWLPTWQDHSVETDDFFAYLDSAELLSPPGQRTLDLALGRVPANSEAEFLAWLRKLQAYESEANNGPWRNTVLLTADDLLVRGNNRIDGITGRAGHTHTSERLADHIQDVRPFTTLNKIYLLDYVENSALEKPVAMRDLFAALNRGARLFTYFGHGSADQLADERLLDGASARAKLSNRDRPFVFFAGSCTVGRFDMPDALGLSEVLLMAPDKGAVATVSGSRPSYPGPNEALGAGFMRNILRPSALGSMTLGEALQSAKNTINITETSTIFGGLSFDVHYDNREVYHLMGDPAMQLLPPPMSVSVSSIAAGDTIPSLERIAVRGTLGESRASSRGIHIAAQAGWVRKTARVYRSATDYVEQSYDIPGQTLFTGTLALADTNFSGDFLTPAKLPFGDTTAFLTTYAWDGMAEGGQRITSLTLSGTGSAVNNDSIGPRIEFRACDSSYGSGIPFTSQAIVPQWGCIEVALSDSSGISSLLGPDEGVVVEIPSIMPAFHPDLQSLSFQQAQVPLTLDERFPPGRYLLKVQARDQMGNPSEAQLQFDVQREFEPALYDVFNRPNPVKKGSTWFHFKVSADPDSNGIVPTSVDAVVRIHTVSGRLVRVLRTQLGPVEDKNPRAEWNLRDSFGQPVANGLYPYTVILRMRKPEGGYVRLERKGVAVVSR